MRLWHKSLIPYLPKSQLLGQWRECVSIAKNIKEKGYPNHILVNPVINYDISHFYSYCRIVYNEMVNRGYNVNWNKLEKWLSSINYTNNNIKFNNLFKNWHNDIYLRQCLYNLEEKFMRGGIPSEEWLLVQVQFGEEFALVDSLYTEKHEEVVQ